MICSLPYITRAPLPAALICRGGKRLLHRRQRAEPVHQGRARSAGVYRKEAALQNEMRAAFSSGKPPEYKQRGVASRRTTPQSCEWVAGKPRAPACGVTADARRGDPLTAPPRGSLSLQSAQPRNRGTVPTTGPAARQADPHIAAKHYHLLTILQRELREQYELPQGLPHKIRSLRAKSAPSGSLSDLAVFA